MPAVPVELVPHEKLREFTQRVFIALNVPPSDAAVAAEVLSAGDLRGVDSHGVARLHAYVTMLRDGRTNPRPNCSVVRESPSTATFDGDAGLGLVIGPKANELAMEKAAKVGTGWVAVRNTQHFGIAGYYPLQALQRDMIGWAMTNATNQVAALWSAQRMLGTNPIAIAFPGDKEPPIVIDMATSVVAYGKIELAAHKNEPMPHGWVLDSHGEIATDATALGPDYALLPLGSDRERGGHKGYCLAAMVDILSAMLSGANWGPFCPPLLSAPQPHQGTKGKGIGHFFGAMQIEAFIDASEFKRNIDDWIQTLRAAKPVPGTNGPLIPGDPEREAERRRRQEGIPLLKPVADQMRAISKTTGVPFD